MGIRAVTKTKKKASLKLYNQINSFLFEQEYDELRNSPKIKLILIDASRALAELIKNN